MNEKLSISKAVLSDLTGVFLSGEDDAEPLGTFDTLLQGHLMRFLLNSQPFPSRESHKVNLEQSMPQPNPWRFAELSRIVINQALSQYKLAEVLVEAEKLEKSIEIISLQVYRFVDEFCSTEVSRFPWPWPPNFDPNVLKAVDFLVAGAEFQKAGKNVNHPSLQNTFFSAANQLFEAGLSRFDNQGAEIN